VAAMFGKMEIKNAKPPTFMAMAVESDGENAKLTIGDKLTADIENIKIGETKLGGKVTPKHIKLDGAVPFPWMGIVTQGRSRSFHYADGAVKWDYKDRNAFFGEFTHKAIVDASPAPAPAK
jgi:hypothetical protein